MFLLFFSFPFSHRDARLDTPTRGFPLLRERQADGSRRTDSHVVGIGAWRVTVGPGSPMGFGSRPKFGVEAER